MRVDQRAGGWWTDQAAENSGFETGSRALIAVVKPGAEQAKGGPVSGLVSAPVDCRVGSYIINQKKQQYPVLLVKHRL